jgi:hypothetical protein
MPNNLFAKIKHLAITENLTSVAKHVNKNIKVNLHFVSLRSVKKKNYIRPKSCFEIAVGAIMFNFVLVGRIH